MYAAALCMYVVMCAAKPLSGKPLYLDNQKSSHGSMHMLVDLYSLMRGRKQLPELDIKVFGRIQLYSHSYNQRTIALLLLSGLAFLHPRSFCLETAFCKSYIYMYCKLLITCSSIVTSLCKLCDGNWFHGSLRQHSQEN